MIFVLHRFQT